MNTSNRHNSKPVALPDMKATFQALEKQRHQAIKAFWVTLVKSLLLLPLCFLPGMLFIPIGDATLWQTVTEHSTSLFDLSTEMETNFAMALFMVGSVWFFGSLYLLIRFFNRRGREPGRVYLRDYKTKVFSQICADHFANLTYKPNSGIPWRVLDDSNLFPWISDWYQSEDLFEGRVEHTDITFAEAHAKRERTRVTGEGMETYLDSYFRGIIFIADFHKHFHSTTRITPAGEKLKRVRKQESVILEDPEFQSFFVTTSTDQSDVRYILSTSMMRRILCVHKRFPKLRILFQDEKMLMLLPAHRDRFEPSLYKRADCETQINSFIADVETLLPVVDELNLNLRIWSKS
ncbi:MAG: DUF3137 domain-containing protein [Pseudomonadaceae bacterium]|nr:DUF3137 domain-containing protein [Pseudomonadaceae bacterium]